MHAQIANISRHSQWIHPPYICGKTMVGSWVYFSLVRIVSSVFLKFEQGINKHINIIKISDTKENRINANLWHGLLGGIVIIVFNVANPIFFMFSWLYPIIGSSRINRQAIYPDSSRYRDSSGVVREEVISSPRVSEVDEEQRSPFDSSEDDLFESETNISDKLAMVVYRSGT